MRKSLFQNKKNYLKLDHFNSFRARIQGAEKL